MTIEFHCPHCDKLLKTPDDKSGVRANCPGCGQTVTVPDPAVEAGHADRSFAAGEPALVTGQAVADGDAGSSPDDTKTCPMCGATIKKVARRCRFCGETFRHQPAGEPTAIDTGEIVNRSWMIFKSQLGLLLGAWIIQIGIGIVLGLGIYAVIAGILFSMIGGGGAPPNPAQLADVINRFGLVITPLAVAINSYFDAGMHVLLLKVARGEPAEIADLFSGGRYYVRVFLANMAFSIPGMLGNVVEPWIAAGGPLLGLLGQMLLALFFWPCIYVIVDRDVKLVEAFRIARSLTALNYGPTILLGLIFLAAAFVGFLACCVGWIFTFPLSMLMFAVAYVAMSGQAVAGSTSA